MKKILVILLSISVVLTSCSENYSKGERIGLVTQFSNSGVACKSWEGHLNLTQTGMNSSSAAPFDFSIDNDHEDTTVIKMIDSAANYGWKVKLVYHETYGKNWFSNRGETNHFITSVTVLDRNPVGSIFGKHDSVSTGGKVVDTIYVVITPSDKRYKDFVK